MKKLNLYRLFEVCHILSEKEYELAENNIYISLLGINSEFSAYSFEQFLNYYSFKIEEENIVVFNTDGVPYEDYDNNDVSYIPICLLSFSAEKIEEWTETEIQKQLKEQEREKKQRKSHIKSEISRLEKQLKEL